MHDPHSYSPEKNLLRTKRSKIKDDREDSLQLARLCANIAEDKKGENISIRDIGKVVAISDYFVLITAASRRQTQAIADGILKEAKALGKICRREGYELGWWVLLDFGSVVVHVLQSEARKYYALDHLWADADTVPVSVKTPRRKARLASS